MYQATLYVYLVFLLVCSGLGAQNLPLNLPLDATTFLTAPTPKETIPDLDIEAKSEVLEKSLQVGIPFHYLVTLSWQGDPAWVSLQPPELSLPKELRQLEVSTGVKTSSGTAGPRGSKYFKFTLEADKAGSFTIPTFSIEVTPVTKSPLNIEVSSVSLIVAERTVPSTKSFRLFLIKNAIQLGGAGFVIVVGVGVALLNRNKSRTQVVVPVVNLWGPFDQETKKLEALRFAGEARAFYAELEALLLRSISIMRGEEFHDSLSKLVDSDLIPPNALDDYKRLVAEISERKFRPDRPSPEEMEMALKHFKILIRQFKEKLPKGV